jgi:pimeloyl-ACP methyl ester carboxylesterase
VSLAELRYGAGTAPALAVHGITGSGVSWAAVGRALGSSYVLVAPDLRGRGHSRDLAPSTGLGSHVDDLAAVAARLVAEHGGPIPLVGHSMGAYVAVHLAYAHPSLFSRVVLVDGGVALPLPADADPDAVLDATLGPAIQRLAQSYPDAEAYVEVFRQHPALGPHWNDDAEAYARYDVLEQPDGTVRARAQEDSVRADGRDLLVSGATFDPELRSIGVPVTILAAPYGMFGQPGGLLPTDGLDALADAAHVSVEVVPELNHYTIVLAPEGAARVAGAISG